jgi:hypothetical protein
MKKKILVIMTAAILVIGVTTIVYAKSNNRLSSNRYKGTMMSQRNINSKAYNNMIDLMKKNGFEAGAAAMESGDINAMSNFMNSITDDQYKQMINIMNKNGYEYMARMMGSFTRQDMINMHNSMMGR